MRSPRLVGLCAAFLAAISATATPLTKESNTAITVDRDSQLLTTGELVVHVVRTDDLLSDYTASHERSLILERLTHVVLRVQLDKDAQTLSINDAKLSLASQAADDRVKVIKGEALMLPKGEMDVEGKHLNAEGLAALADKVLPPGIVAAKISIEEEAAEPTAVIKTGSEGEDAVVSMKSYKVSLKIVEVDSQAVAHEVSLMVPVLKVQLSYQADGKPVEMKAFAIRPLDGRRGQKAIEGHHRQHHEDEARHSHHDHNEEEDEEAGPLRRPHRHHWDSQDIDEDSEVDAPRRHHHHHHEDHEDGEEGHVRYNDRDEDEFEHRPHHHPWHHGPPPPPPPPFIRWVADLLGFKPPPPPRHPHWRHHRPHFENEDDEVPHSHRVSHHRDNGEDGIERPRHRIGLAGAGLIDVTGDAPIVRHGPHRNAEGTRSYVRRPWRHAHRRFRHRRFACRMRRFFRRHSATLFVASFVAKLALFSAFLFAVVRRIKKVVKTRREQREGAIRLPDDDVVREKEDVEAVEVVVEKS